VKAARGVRRKPAESTPTAAPVAAPLPPAPKQQRQSLPSRRASA